MCLGTRPAQPSLPRRSPGAATDASLASSYARVRGRQGSCGGTSILSPCSWFSSDVSRLAGRPPRPVRRSPVPVSDRPACPGPGNLPPTPTGKPSIATTAGPSVAPSSSPVTTPCPAVSPAAIASTVARPNVDSLAAVITDSLRGAGQSPRSREIRRCCTGGSCAAMWCTWWRGRSRHRATTGTRSTSRTTQPTTGTRRSGGSPRPASRASRGSSAVSPSARPGPRRCRTWPTCQPVLACVLRRAPAHLRCLAWGVRDVRDVRRMDRGASLAWRHLRQQQRHVDRRPAGSQQQRLRGERAGPRRHRAEGGHVAIGPRQSA